MPRNILNCKPTWKKNSINLNISNFYSNYQLSYSFQCLFNLIISSDNSFLRNKNKKLQSYRGLIKFMLNYYNFNLALIVKYKKSTME